MAPIGRRGGRRGARTGERAGGRAYDSTQAPITHAPASVITPVQGSTDAPAAPPPTSVNTSDSNVLGASLNTSDSNVRGVTCGRGTRVAKKAAKSRLTVAFDFALNQAVCDNTERFNNEIGYIIRNHCSFAYKEWRLVPLNVRMPLRDRLLSMFDIDVNDGRVIKVIDGQMQRAWRGHKYKLHNHFKEVGGEQDPTKAKNNCPDEDRAQKNADNRAKRKWDSRNGSKSTARHHVSRGVDLDAPTGHIETWRLRHWHSERGWTSLDLEAKYEEMLKLRQDNPAEKMTDKEILEKVLGHQSVRLFGWGRSPSTSQTACTSEDPKRPSYDELMEQMNKYKLEVNEIRGNMDLMLEALIAKNIMPPLPSRQYISDHNSGHADRVRTETSHQSSSEFVDETH